MPNNIQMFGSGVGCTSAIAAGTFVGILYGGLTGLALGVVSGVLAAFAGVLVGQRLYLVLDYLFIHSVYPKKKK